MRRRPVHAGNGRKLILGCIFDFFDAAKCRKKLFGSGLTYAVNLGERGGKALFRTAKPMIFNGKSVNLILNLRYQGKDLTYRLYLNFSVFRHKGAGPVVTVLDHTEHRQVDIHVIHNLFHGRKLPRSAVKKDKVGKPSEALAALLVFFIFGKSAG